jgi:hypothetical protein
MDNKKAKFLPFHALNEFMRPDYRLEVVRVALYALPELPENFRTPIEHLTRKFIQVPGFRNSGKAPAALRVRPTAEAFEKRPDLVAAILSAWAESHSELRQRIYDLLKARNWDLLPPEADRTKLPGFLPDWPSGEDFDILNEAYKEMFPEATNSTDDISLMVVWLSGQLPFPQETEEEQSDVPSSDTPD